MARWLIHSSGFSGMTQAIRLLLSQEFEQTVIFLFYFSLFSWNRGEQMYVQINTQIKFLWQLAVIQRSQRISLRRPLSQASDWVYRNWGPYRWAGFPSCTVSPCKGWVRSKSPIDLGLCEELCSFLLQLTVAIVFAFGCLLFKCLARCSGGRTVTGAGQSQGTGWAGRVCKRNVGNLGQAWEQKRRD